MVIAASGVPKRQEDESRFVKTAGVRRAQWKRSSDVQPKSRWLPLCKQVTEGREASAQAGITVSRSTAYRLLRQVRSRGKAAFEDGRHGHPAKLRTDERAWLETYCHTSPGTPSRMVQTAFQERFGIQISIGYLNQVRARLGLGSRTPVSGKKTGCRLVPTS